MKKNKILTPILGLVTITTPLLSLASCGCTTNAAKIEWSGDNITNVTSSTIELNKELTIVVICKDGYMVNKVEAIKVGDTTLTASDYSVDTNSNTIVIKASAMKSVSINIKIKTTAITGNITSLYDEYLKTLDVYTVEKAAINYLFESRLVSSLVGISVKVKNLKINGVAPYQDVPAGLIKVALKHNSLLRVDFDIVKLFEYYGFTEDSTVTFDLQFKDDYTSLDKTITGYTLNVKTSTPAPTEEYPLSNENDGISEIEGTTFGCDGWIENHFILCMNEVFRTEPKLMETINCTSIYVTSFTTPITTPFTKCLISFPQDSTVDPAQSYGGIAVDIPSCVKTFKLNVANAGMKIIIDFPASTDTSKNPFGFETIDLGSSLEQSDETGVYLTGCVHGSKGSLYRNLNLKKIILTPKRKTTFTVNDESGYPEGNSPIEGCENLNTLDMSRYSNEFELGTLTFENGTNGTNKIFNSNKKTHAATGTVIVKKDAGDEWKTLIKNKLQDAGLTIDGTNWKIVEAE